MHGSAQTVRKKLQQQNKHNHPENPPEWPCSFRCSSLILYGEARVSVVEALSCVVVLDWGVAAVAQKVDVAADRGNRQCGFPEFFLHEVLQLVLVQALAFFHAVVDEKHPLELETPADFLSFRRVLADDFPAVAVED